MAAANRALKPQPPRRVRAVAILLLLCAGVAGVPIQLAGLVALALDVPFFDAIHVVLMLFGVASLTAVLVLRLRGYVARGILISDAGREPRRKLFAWLAAISFIAGVVILETVRREAEVAPVHSRIRQLLELRQPILNRTQNLLDRQRALLAIVPPDLNGVQRLGQLIKQEQGESSGLGKLIDSEIAEEQRLTYRLFPAWTEIQQSLTDLRRGLAALPSHPWNVLASKHAWQLWISVFAIANGFISLLIATGHRQIRGNGIWHGGLLLRWEHIGSYRWEDDTLVVLIGKIQSPLSLSIAREGKPAVENHLATKLVANQ